MNKAELHLKSACSEVKIDGRDIAHLVSGLKLEQYAGELPTMTLDIVLLECTISVDGGIRLNDATVSDEIAYEVYKMLHERFKDNEPPLREEA